MTCAIDVDNSPMMVMMTVAAPAHLRYSPRGIHILPAELGEDSTHIAVESHGNVHT